MIQKLLLNTQKIWIFIQILKIVIQIKSKKYWLYLMIWLLISLVPNKNLNPIVTELFIRGRKLNISLEHYIAAPKNIRLNSTHYFLMKIPNKRELQQIAFNSYHILTFRTLWGMIFWGEGRGVLILLLHQIILYVSERIF